MNLAIDARRATYAGCPECPGPALAVVFAGGSSWNEEIEQVIRWSDYDIVCRSCGATYVEHVVE